MSSDARGGHYYLLKFEEEAFAIAGRGTRVLVYTAALLLAPLPVMPFAPGTREFAWAVGACGAVLAAASFYTARGEWRLKHRGLLGNKLLAASLITLLFGMALVAGSFVHLAYGKTVGGGLKVEPLDSRRAKGDESFARPFG